MKSVDECICPRCESKLMFMQTVLKPDDVKCKIICGWCYWESKEYNFEMEAIENYETEVL